MRARELFASFRKRRPPEDRAPGGGGVLSEPELWTLLRELDDPRHLEFPPGFRHRPARAKFEKLVVLLDRAFDCTTEVDRNVQDANYHGTIVIPTEATESGEFLTVTISNFGEMATPALGNPDSYSAEEVHLLFDPDDRARVDGALQALGYVVVSEVLLRAEYRRPQELTGPATEVRRANGSSWRLHGRSGPHHPGRGFSCQCHHPGRGDRHW